MSDVAESIEKIYDRGLIHTMHIKPQGIVALARWAVADQSKRYLNRDGSSRYETTTEKELFSDLSTQSAGLSVVTLGHTADGDEPHPGNYKRVAVGSCGDTVIREIVGGKSILSTVIAIRDEEAINWVLERKKAGLPLATSPGFSRVPVKDSADPNHFFQTQRDHFEFALVDEARGGQLIKVMDSVAESPFNLWRFDPDQIDEDWMNFMARDGDQESAGKIQRIMQYGSLSPPAVHLPETNPPTNNSENMTTIPFQLGDKQINIGPDSIKDATDYVAEFTRLKGELDSSREVAKKFYDAQGKMYELTNQVTSLRDELAAKDSAKDSAASTAIAVQKYLETSEILARIKDEGISVTQAEYALKAYDTATCRQLIATIVMPTLAANSSEECVDLVLGGYTSQMPSSRQKDAAFGYTTGEIGRLNLPSEYLQSEGEKVTFEDLINGRKNGNLPIGTNFLASDSDWLKS